MAIESPITKFCKKKGVSGQIKSAFTAYIRSHYAAKFGMSESGETVHIILNKLSNDDLEAAWQDFVKELRNHLPTQGSK